MIIILMMNYIVNCGFENIETIIHAGAYTPKSSSDGNAY